MNDNQTYPLVSVIIPYFNHGDFIDDAIHSILRQEYSSLEIIVIDDCSTQKDSIEKFELLNETNVIKLRTIQNSGPSVARNLGIKAAKGKYILPLDGDDQLGDIFIKEAIEMMEVDNQIMVVYGNGLKFGAVDQPLYVLPFEQFIFLHFNPLFVTAIIRRTALEAVGLYDQNLSKLGLEDWELWISFGERQYKFRKLELCFLKIRILNNSRTFQVANKNLDSIYEYIYKKHWKFLFDSYEFLLAQNRDIYRTWEYRLGQKVLSPIRKLKSILR